MLCGAVESVYKNFSMIFFPQDLIIKIKRVVLFLDGSNFHYSLKSIFEV